MKLIFHLLFVFWGKLNLQEDSLNKAEEKDIPAAAYSLGSLCMPCTHTLGPNCKMETVCFPNELGNVS